MNTHPDKIANHSRASSLCLLLPDCSASSCLKWEVIGRLVADIDKRESWEAGNHSHTDFKYTCILLRVIKYSVKIECIGFLLAFTFLGVATQRIFCQRDNGSYRSASGMWLVSYASL